MLISMNDYVVILIFWRFDIKFELSENIVEIFFSGLTYSREIRTLDGGITGLPMNSGNQSPVINIIIIVALYTIFNKYFGKVNFDVFKLISDQFSGSLFES